MRKFLFLLVVPFVFTGCKKSQDQIDDQIIKSYISAHHLTAIQEPNGLYYVPINQGSGSAYPNINSQIVVNYKGYLTNDSVFDQSGSSPSTFLLSDMISGWQEAIPLMQKGASATILIPSALGYGANSYGVIPANSVLIFDIQLVRFQ